MPDCGEASRALKRKENIGLKLKLEKCGKLKFFNLTFTVFSIFLTSLKIKFCYVLLKAAKIAELF